MSKEAESKLTTLRERLASGDYDIDARQIAAAILSRPGSMALFQLRLTDVSQPGAQCTLRTA